MAKITVVDPTAWRKMEMPSGHFLQLGAPLEVPNSTIRSIDNARFLAPLTNSKVIEVVMDEDPDDGSVEALVSIVDETDQTPTKSVQETPKGVPPLTNPTETKPGVGGPIPAASGDPSGIKGSSTISDK